MVAGRFVLFEAVQLHDPELHQHCNHVQLIQEKGQGNPAYEILQQDHPRAGTSTLFTSSKTGIPVRLRKFAISSSRAVKPSLPSTTKSTRSELELLFLLVLKFGGRANLAHLAFHRYQRFRKTAGPIRKFKSSVTCHSWFFRNQSAVFPTDAVKEG